MTTNGELYKRGFYGLLGFLAILLITAVGWGKGVLDTHEERLNALDVSYARQGAILDTLIDAVAELKSDNKRDHESILAEIHKIRNNIPHN